MRSFYTLILLLLLLAGCGAADDAPVSGLSSLTGEDFHGRKHYLGWAEYLDGFMGNETKYDVQHTHDIFTSGAGGAYEATRLADTEVDRSDIRAAWSRIGAEMTSEDMYVQYSSGHGSPSGLGVGVSYDEIRDATLALPGRETIVFIMSCYSGGLVEAFDERRAEWQDRAAQGRTLFVMASSRASESSSTGPGTDRDEPGGPNGSAGSAFGHALWKALLGYADGTVDGVADGFLTLEEITEFTRRTTEDLGGHTPVVTGAYNPHLVMNQAPRRAP